MITFYKSEWKVRSIWKKKGVDWVVPMEPVNVVKLETSKMIDY
jgi:hypothetical protein